MAEAENEPKRRSFSEGFESVLAMLGINAENLIGVLFSGLGFWFSLKIISKYHTDEMFDAIRGIDKTTEFIAFVIFFGSIVFLIFKRLIGELFLWPLQHYIHKIYDDLYNKAPTSPVWMMRIFGVPGGIYALRTAYDHTKNEWMPRQGHPEIGISHGELHIMYLTSIFLFVVGIFVPHSLLFIVLGLLIMIIAVLADTKQHIGEGKLFWRRREDIKAFLRETYYI